MTHPEPPPWDREYYLYFMQSPKPGRETHAYASTHRARNLLPSSSSSKSSTKNSFSGGRFGFFRVFRSCWILEDTLLFTGTPVTGGAKESDSHATQSEEDMKTKSGNKVRPTQICQNIHVPSTPTKIHWTATVECH